MLWNLHPTLRWQVKTLLFLGERLQTVPEQHLFFPENTLGLQVENSLRHFEAWRSRELAVAAWRATNSTSSVERIPRDMISGSSDVCDQQQRERGGVNKGIGKNVTVSSKQDAFFVTGINGVLAYFGLRTRQLAGLRLSADVPREMETAE